MIQKNKFIKIIKSLIKTRKKVIIEGQLHVGLIKNIVGKNTNYQVVLVKPKNKIIWLKNLISRFEKDPANYGRIGWMKTYDEENNKIGLNDYIKNGINGKYITQLLKKVVNGKYHKHKLVLEYHRKHFDNLIVFLDKN